MSGTGAISPLGARLAIIGGTATLAGLERA
jgi:hypothetical protein